MAVWVYRRIYQEVCPWNVRFAEVAAERDYAAREAWEAEWDCDPDDPDDDGPTEAVIPTTDGPALVDLMRMSEDEWDAYTRGSAIRMPSACWWRRCRTRIRWWRRRRRGRWGGWQDEPRHPT